MTRKDAAADLDRPHYYSQFWIDVAMGKRDISSAGATETVAPTDELSEPEFAPEFAPEPEPLPIAAMPAPSAVKKKPEKEKEKDKKGAPLTSLADLASIDMLMKSSAEMEGDEIPDIEAGPTSDLAPIITDFDVSEAEDDEPAYLADEEDADLGDTEFDEEEEDEWGNTRKPSKPQKQQRRRERPERGRTF
jgi:hypothetical protein